MVLIIGAVIPELMGVHGIPGGRTAVGGARLWSELSDNDHVY